MAYWPNVYTICASLVCDDSNQVLDGDDNPIEGLYAAGNAGGSFFGYYCPVSGFSAAGVSHALVGGPLAAASALGKTLDDLPKAKHAIDFKRCPFQSRLSSPAGTFLLCAINFVRARDAEQERPPRQPKTIIMHPSNISLRIRFTSRPISSRCHFSLRGQPRVRPR